jgi:hypothetical protein
MKKKILSALMAVVICFSAFSFVAIADDETAVKDKDALQALVTSLTSFRNTELSGYGNNTIRDFTRAFVHAERVLRATGSIERDYTAAFYVLQAAYDSKYKRTAEELAELVAATKHIYDTDNIYNSYGDNIYRNGPWNDFVAAWRNANFNNSANTNVITTLWDELNARRSPARLDVVTKAAFNQLMARATSFEANRTLFTDERRSSNDALGNARTSWGRMWTGEGWRGNAPWDPCSDCDGGPGCGWTGTQRYNCDNGFEWTWFGVGPSYNFYTILRDATTQMELFNVRQTSDTTNAGIVGAFEDLTDAIRYISGFIGDATESASAATFRQVMADAHNAIVDRENGVVGGGGGNVNDRRGPFLSPGHAGTGALAALYAEIAAQMEETLEDFWVNASGAKYSDLVGSPTPSSIDSTFNRPAANIIIVFERSNNKFIAALAGNANTGEINAVIPGSETLTTPGVGGNLKYGTFFVSSTQDADLRRFVTINSSEEAWHISPGALNALGSTYTFDWVGGSRDSKAATYTVGSAQTKTLAQLWSLAELAVAGGNPDPMLAAWYNGDLINYTNANGFALNLSNQQKLAQLYRVFLYALEPFTGFTAGQDGRTLAQLRALIARAEGYYVHDIPLFTQEMLNIRATHTAAVAATLVQYTPALIAVRQHETDYLAAYKPLEDALKAFDDRYAAYPYSVTEALTLIYNAAQWMDENPGVDLIPQITALANAIIGRDAHFNLSNEMLLNSRLGGGHADAGAYKTLFDALDKEVNPDYVLGDVNGDGAINTADALLILMHIAALEVLEGDALKAASITADAPTTACAMAILMYSAELIDTLEGLK